MNATPQVQSIENFDLNRYLGQWFEIGRLPLKWQDKDSKLVTASYSLNDDGSVRVDNRCFDENDDPVQAVGRAEIVEGETAQLKVSFLPKFLQWIPFTDGDYWVLRLAEDYSIALVGTPDHKHLWLLSRTAELPDQVIDDYLATAQAQGFELEEWIRTPQNGGAVDDAEVDE